MPTIMITVDGLSKSFGWRDPVIAVDNVSFSVEKGRILGLLGPKDAGKTTVLRILATTLTATSGSVNIGGFDILTQTRQARRILGYMPEAIDFGPWASGLDFLSFWCRVCGLSGADRKDRIRELMEFLEIPDELSGDPSNYTVDLQRRLVLAQALISDPDVLLLDEPMRGLSGDGRDPFIRMIDDLKGQRKTIAMSSPFLSDIQASCDTVSLMAEGSSTKVYEMQELLREVGMGKHARVFIKSDAISSEDLSFLRELEGIIDVKPSPVAIIVYVDPGKVGASDLARALETRGVKVETIAEAEITLGDVFRALYIEES